MNILACPKIVYGKGSLGYLRQVQGQKAVIIAGKVTERLGFVDQVTASLKEAGIQVERFCEVEPEPSLESIMRGVGFVNDIQPDLIVGLGGGSSIDAAKLIWMYYENPGININDPLQVLRARFSRKARLIAVPTTSGTGSEVTRFASLSDPERGSKVEIGCMNMIADLVIVDGEFAGQMPAGLAADTGIDALTHAIEAYVCRKKNDFSDALAVKAIQLIFTYLPRSCTDQKDMVAKEKMHYAATMAGLAFSNSQLGLAHSLGHALGVMFKIPHGKTLSAVLPCVIQYNEPKVSGLYSELVRSLKAMKNLLVDDNMTFTDLVKKLLKSIDEPDSIQALGIQESDFRGKLDRLIEFAQKDICTEGNPRDVTPQTLRRLYEYAYLGKDIDF